MAEGRMGLAERIDRIGHAGQDGQALRVAMLEEIERNVAFDAYAWLLTDPETEVGSDPLADVPCLPELPTLIRLKYSTDINRWTRLPTAVGRLQADTGGHPERSLVWRELLSGYHVSDVASVVFRDRFGCWETVLQVPGRVPELNVSVGVPSMKYTGTCSSGASRRKS